MSMHEIEDMVEGAVRVLHRRAPADDAAPRSQFAKLFQFQQGLDTSFTHFRVMDLLLARRFVYRFQLDDHPDFEARAAFFKGIEEFTFLHDNPAADTGEADGEWDEPRPVAGYLQPPHLYCDAGSSLWRRMVDAGRLKGPDAEPPVPLKLIDVVHEVLLGAEAEGDLDLLANWFNLGPSTLFGDSFTRQVRKGELLAKNPFTGKDVFATEDFLAHGRFTLEELQAHPRALPIRDLARRTRALECELAYDMRPSPETLAQSPAHAWWWEGL